MTTVVTELKPCPFCGGDASEETAMTANVGGKPFRYVICTECSGQSDFHDWNTRSIASLQTDQVELVARAMCIAAGNDPDSTVGRLNKETGECDPLWQAYEKMALAALQAIEINEERET